jgi:hypothetical protein
LNVTKNAFTKYIHPIVDLILLTALNLFRNSRSGSARLGVLLFLVAELLRAIVTKATGLPENHSHSS